MSVQGSATPYLRFYESYARGPEEPIHNTPRGGGDFRERVERETIRGRYGVFHTNIEMYLYRHWRAYTVPRVAMFWFCSFSLMQHSFASFLKTFPNLEAYSRIKHHPNYKLLGPVHAWFFILRPVVWTYVFARMTRFLTFMIIRHYQGKGDLHYFWYYDTLYPDMFFDDEDMRYINFRYTDNKVVPDGLNGYYPLENLKWGEWLN